MASLLDLVEALVRDPAAKAAYRADPDEFLDSRGFGELEPADFEEALHQAADSFPPTLAAHVDPTQGFDSLVHVDLQELGFDDELRPLDPLDDGPEPAGWHGPALGDDVAFDAPAGSAGHHDGPEGPGGADSLDAELSVDRPDGRSDQAAADADDGDVEASAAAAAGRDDTAGRDESAGLDDDVDGSDQPAAAAWADDPFDRPGLGPDGDDPWFYSQDQPTFVAPDDVDDDILDDVDDFNRDS
jgi:hypothetical protein